MSSRIFLKDKTTQKFVTDLFSSYPIIGFMDISEYVPNIGTYPLSFQNIEGLKSFIQCEIKRLSVYHHFQTYHSQSFKNLEIVRIEADWNYAVDLRFGYTEYFDIWKHIIKSLLYCEMKNRFNIPEIFDMYIAYTNFWGRDGTVNRSIHNNYDIFIPTTQKQAEDIRELLAHQCWISSYNNYVWCKSEDLNLIKLSEDLNIIPVFNVVQYEEIKNRYQSFLY